MVYQFNDMRFSVKNGDPEPIDVPQLDKFEFLRTQALEVSRTDIRFLNGTRRNNCVYIPDKQLPAGVSDFGAYVNEGMRTQAEAVILIDALVRRVSF